MSKQEAREIIAFLKEVLKEDASAHHKLLGDVSGFLRRAAEYGLLDESFNEIVVQEKNLELRENGIRQFVNGKPLIVIGKQGFAPFQNTPKTLVLNSKNSIEGAMVGAVAFLTKNTALIDELQQGVKNKEALVRFKLFVKNDRRLALLASPEIIVMPTLKPILEWALAQLADEEETILISG